MHSGRQSNARTTFVSDAQLAVEEHLRDDRGERRHTRDCAVSSHALTVRRVTTRRILANSLGKTGGAAQMDTPAGSDEDRWDTTDLLRDTKNASAPGLRRSAP